MQMAAIRAAAVLKQNVESALNRRELLRSTIAPPDHIE
jgi:hypothetical protein